MSVCIFLECPSGRATMAICRPATRWPRSKLFSISVPSKKLLQYCLRVAVIIIDGTDYDALCIQAARSSGRKLHDNYVSACM
jgi:hypothetical protein